jgi:hypothetical protein
MRLVPASTVCLALVLSSPSAAQSPPRSGAEAALAALDMRQKAMVARADVAALDALSAPELTINAPVGRILTRAQYLAMMRDGRIRAETFERTIESVTIAGDIGIVMGREVFTPTPQSELGRTYGAVPLDRRYTNVYRRVGGKWRWLARHANVVLKKAVDIR